MIKIWQIFLKIVIQIEIRQHVFLICITREGKKSLMYIFPSFNHESVENLNNLLIREDEDDEKFDYIFDNNTSPWFLNYKSIGYNIYSNYLPFHQNTYCHNYSNKPA